MARVDKGRSKLRRKKGCRVGRVEGESLSHSRVWCETDLYVPIGITSVGARLPNRRIEACHDFWHQGGSAFV